MTIPVSGQLFLPILSVLGDGSERHNRDVISMVAKQLSLTEEERNAYYPSGKAKAFDNRVMWARFSLVQSGLIESPKRGYMKITQKGLEFIKGQKTDLPIFIPPTEETKRDIEQNPQELIEAGFQEITKSLSSELLGIIKSCSPEFFERLVIQLLLKMGYGGSRENAGKRIGGSGDGGVDGIINEDKLGLDVIYIQAKKWENVVGRPEIQKFVGALQGQRAKKGVFITTSYFSSDARGYVENIENRVVLIDGEQLAQFMIDHNVGVSTVDTYEIKKIDSDFFSEEQY